MALVTLASLDDGRLLAVLDGTAGGTGSLDGLDVLEGLIVGNLAEDDVATVQPGGHDGGDEELGAVAGSNLLAHVPNIGCTKLGAVWAVGDVRVGAGVGHGQQTRAGVLDLEVLIGKLLAVDGLATSAVTTGEVTTLKHELRDDTVEGRALVLQALIALAELQEVLGGLGDDVVVEVEVNHTRLDFMAGIEVSNGLLRRQGGSKEQASRSVFPPIFWQAGGWLAGALVTQGEPAEWAKRTLKVRELGQEGKGCVGWQRWVMVV